MDKESILQRLLQQEGHVGFYCENLVTGENFGFNQDDSFLAASVIKFPIFMCISKWAAEGKADFDEKIKVKNEDKVPICGALTLFTDEPAVDIRTLCNLMISLSDNAATNILIKRFGTESYEKEFRRLGLEKTKLNRLLFDEDAGAKGLENYICLKEIAMLLKQVYNRSFVCEKTSKEIEDTLLLQQINHKIPGVIGDGTVPIAHKTGEDDRITNDVGIVFSKEPFIICFAGNDVNVPDFENIIRRVSFEVFEEYNR